MLHLVGSWFGDENDQQALAVLDLARQNLLYDSNLPAPDRFTLACAYAEALGQAPIRLAQGRYEEMFQQLTGLYEVRQTNSHFALAPLVLVDTVVLAVVNEDFTLGPAARRWLEDDEFAVRQHMQRDLIELARK
jgi:hypothetical protein